MDGCKRGDVTLLPCQTQSGLFSTCQTLSEVGVETGDLFYFQASLEEFLPLLKI